MAWVALGGAAIGAVGSMYSANKQAKTAKELAKQQQQYGTAGQTAEQQAQAAKDAQIWASDQNKSNQLWANDINQGNLQAQMDSNRIGQTNAFGNQVGYDAEGNQFQKFGSADQSTLDALRGQRDSAIGGMSNTFDVNGDVMNAYKALQDPLLQQRQDKENARLAAMGLSTGSGSAWQQSQQALNDMRTRADSDAILKGFDANQQLQQSNRANLGALNTTQNTLQSGLQQPDFWKVGTTAVNAPTVSAQSPELLKAWGADMGMMNNNAVNQSNAAAGWGNLAGSLGGAVGQVDWGGLFGNSGNVGSPQGSFINNSNNGVATTSPVANPYAGMTSTPLP